MCRTIRPLGAATCQCHQPRYILSKPGDAGRAQYTPYSHGCEVGSYPAGPGEFITQYSLALSRVLLILATTCTARAVPRAEPCPAPAVREDIAWKVLRGGRGGYTAGCRSIGAVYWAGSLPSQDQDRRWMPIGDPPRIPTTNTHTHTHTHTK